MAKPLDIELTTGERIPILYEDRSVIAIDKPVGWMLVPFTWQRTDRNLQAALVSSIASHAFWATSRNLKFLRHVHRLDAETTGILLLARSPGSVQAFGELFESRRMEKRYLAVVNGVPPKDEWMCRAPIGPDLMKVGKMRVDPRHGKDAETSFRVVVRHPLRALVEARPFTGRTHQIRLHLAHEGLPILGDSIYGNTSRPSKMDMGLRAIELAYIDPFTRKPTLIKAPVAQFLTDYGFPSNILERPATRDKKSSG